MGRPRQLARQVGRSVWATSRATGKIERTATSGEKPTVVQHVQATQHSKQGLENKITDEMECLFKFFTTSRAIGSSYFGPKSSNPKFLSKFLYIVKKSIVEGAF